MTPPCYIAVADYEVVDIPRNVAHDYDLALAWAAAHVPWTVDFVVVPDDQRTDYLTSAQREIVPGWILTDVIFGHGDFGDDFWARYHYHGVVVRAFGSDATIHEKGLERASIEIARIAKVRGHDGQIGRVQYRWDEDDDDMRVFYGEDILTKMRPSPLPRISVDVVIEMPV
jgi:hypothetical protein